jgi:two-component system phosphate regulon sensor histidine kinase PhoR
MDFFRFIAHEMKSPISTIQSALETIKSISSNTLDVRANKLINKSITKTKQVLDTVKDIVDMTQGRERSVVDKSLINIKKLIEFAIHLVENEHTQKAININLNCSEDLELITQPELMEKILSNLISNAVRYSGNNAYITIDVQDENETILIKIQDNGIGINKNDIGNIFKEFYRTSEAKEKERIGTGLGLSIVKRFTELLDGTVHVKSEISKGTTFTLEFNKYV